MDERMAALFRRAAPRQAASVLIFGAVLFGAASTFRYWQGWLFLVAFIGSSIALGLYVAKHDPALIERRMRAGPRAEREPAQKVIIALLMADFLLMIVLPALDHRWHWSPLPAWLSILGAAGIVASFAVFFYVMKQNSYAASTVRVEAEQPVISTGLYGVVRHPMYMGALLLVILNAPYPRLASARRGARAEARFARLQRLLPAGALPTDPWPVVSWHRQTCR